MLVHSCFVDDGAGHNKKPLLDEHGCSIDTVIVPDLNYNHAANLAYTEVSAFKFADKVTTYFQCAVSTCMISEGMCEGKTVSDLLNNLQVLILSIIASSLWNHQRILCVKKS